MRPASPHCGIVEFPTVFSRPGPKPHISTVSSFPCPSGYLQHAMSRHSTQVLRWTAHACRQPASSTAVFLIGTCADMLRGRWWPADCCGTAGKPSLSLNVPRKRRRTAVDYKALNQVRVCKCSL